FTHLGNGIPRALDRHDNVLWRVLDAGGLAIGLIPDGIHVSPALFRLMHRLSGDTYYTTDAIAAAGSPPGRYTIGGIALEVGADQVVREQGKSNFAGSALAPLQGVLRAARMLGCSWQDPWLRASLAPRQLIGLADPLAIGQPADFCVIEGDREPRVVAVFADGVEVARHQSPSG
ncbi:MAG: N-acetylglucosamine-6-phosphate deacetylase, partial [Planctomycetes bacterium]|nr:N-acetylglucosamine-6-phosphate deacetylase [Planctomycetota bacterium]